MSYIYNKINNIYNKIIRNIIQKNIKTYKKDYNSNTNLTLMGILLTYYPNVINDSNSVQFKYFINYLKDILYCKDSYKNKMIKLDILSQRFNIKYLPYTNINMIFDLKNTSKKDYICYNDYDIMDIIINFCKVGYIIKINNNSFAVCCIDKNETKKTCEILNGKHIEFQDSHLMKDNNYIIQTVFIENKNNIIKKQFNWANKSYKYYIEAPSCRQKMYIEDVIKFNNYYLNQI